MQTSSDRDVPGASRRRTGRIVLLVIGLAALAAVFAPEMLRSRWARDLCPTEITDRGEVAGVVWEVARSTCAADRVVWQLRIVPPKGVSTLVYEAETGPAPSRWQQAGFAGRVILAAPLATGENELAVDLDLKGRPLSPIRVKAGRRIE